MRFLSLLILVNFSTIANLAAMTLDFEDMPHIGVDYEEMVDGGFYNGFRWGRDTYVIHKDYYSESGYNIGATSGDYSVFFLGDKNTSRDRTYFESYIPSDHFNFHGAYFTSAWTETAELTIYGYRDDALVASTTVAISNSSATWVDFYIADIDAMAFSSNGSQYVMDDFSYSVVPIPAAFWMFGSALGGLGWMRRRKIA